MKVITIYELLGLIKDGKAPKKIKLNGVIFKYTGDDYLYRENNEEHWLFSSGYTDKYMWLDNFLNAEIEILEDEEEFEDIEELYNCLAETDNEIEKILIQNINDLSGKINQLIRNQKKIIERLNNGK